MTYSLNNETKVVTYESREYSPKLMGDGSRIAWTEDEVKILHQQYLEGHEIYKQGLKDKYKSKRRNEYPPMEDYLDAIVKDDDTQKQKYIDDCNAVKTKYPKPTAEEIAEIDALKVGEQL
tara:strand:- start:19 stop:378 length:360 start_codon:yes stop_codon:yes gene_type:complete